MKWREPWRSTLRRQESWRLISRSNLRSIAIWTLCLFVIGALSAYAKGTSLVDFASRAWFAPAVGGPLALMLSLGHWLSPLTVDSGPRGIVRSKGEALALIPWSSIRSYRFREAEGERVLELEVGYSPEPELLYLSRKVKVEAIEHELRAHVRPEA